MPTLETSHKAHESKLYAEFSHLYDLVFARIFYPRIASVIRSLEIPAGAKILEIGVGTGLSLQAYPRHAQVTGVDLAPDMLELAQEKINRNGWRHIRVLEMNAMNLDFLDASFDYVMAFHIVSVVPDARKLMQEAQRVCRPGGMIVVINHFRSRQRLLAAIDKWLEPVTRRLGWHTLRQAEVFDDSELELVRVYREPRRSLFTIVVARNETEPVDDSMPRFGAGVDRRDAVAQ